MDGKRFIRTIRLENILSYGPDSTEFELLPLNVLIGPNASGKSNLIEALSLLESAPSNLQRPIEMGGGTREWLWKGQDDLPIATIEVTVEHPNQLSDIRYKLSFSESKAGDFKLEDEKIEWTGNKNINGEHLSITNNKQSMMSQIHDPIAYPELDYLRNKFGNILFYRKPELGHYKSPHIPTPIDFPQKYLSENASNINAVLSNVLENPELKELIMNYMKDFYPNIYNIGFEIRDGSVLMYMREQGLNHPIPATRVADGTLRFLSLLMILFHPEPPPVICIEKPESGLHPDILPEVAKLIVEASSRSQIIVTTNSDILVDALTDYPESIIVCEKPEASTLLQRLEREEIERWLSAYRGGDDQLGTLWTSGAIGGNRW